MNSAAGNDLGTAIKYLQSTTSGAGDNDLAATAM
jgi:hypothetical protein